MARERIGVWIEDQHVADLETTNHVDLSCRYTDVALETWPNGTPLLSCSLPVTRKRQDAMAFGQGLLPEGHALRALAANIGVSVTDTFSMLRRYGRDIAGALVVADEAPSTHPGATEPYTDGGLVDAVDGLDERPLDVHDDSELSIAGMQDKLLLVQTADGWARPVNGQPSTHILKRDDLRFPGLVSAEAAALRLARALDLTTIDPLLLEVGGHQVLIVDRFDRAVTASGVQRLHQEDLCQAMGRLADGAGGRGKYEQFGGPGFGDFAELLDAYAADPVQQLQKLLRIAVFTVLIGNSDAHAKNLALLHRRPGQIEIAPLYDTVPTVLWPKLPSRAAMHVGGQASLPAVTVQHLIEEARTWAMSTARAARLVDGTLAEVIEAAPVCGHERLQSQIVERARQLTA